MIRWIPEDSLSKDLILLGEGTFTQVWKADLRKKVGNKTRITTVAIKCPKMDAPQIVQQKFSQSVDQMASWEHSHIIRFEGIGGGYKLVMQYASEGSLDRYMRRMGEGRRLGVTSQLTAAYQLMDALEYLETKRYAHGNVSAHNVLVSRSAPDIIIKLADPMLGAYYHSLDMKNHAKLQRARWTAPELLATNSEPTYAGDKFSYAITLWQIMSHGAIPEDKLSDDQVKYNYLNGVRLDPPEDCPNVLMRIMESCWSHIPSNRPPCRGVLRDIHNLLELSRDKPEFRDHGEVAMIPTESDDEDDDHTDLDNVDNERRDTISPPNSSSDGGAGAGSGIGRPTGTTRVADILDEIAEHLNAQGDEDILDPEGETRFIGVNKIQNGELKREGQLGKGNFGTVFKAVLKPAEQCLPAETVAVKVLIKSESKPEQFHQEIRALSYCDHKNIVKVIGYCDDSSSDNSNCLSLVMEYLPLGSLEKYIQERQDRVSHKTLYLFGQQICQGMKYLHEVRMMVHRDLAARNVLVASENEVKITDFGLARIFGTEKDYYRAKEVGQKVPVKWYAPEWLKHNKYLKESDVWSFGIVLWEMFSYGGKIHYRDQRGVEVGHGDLLDFLEKGNRLPPPPSCPSAIDTMMQHCWRFDPAERPKFQALIHRLGNLVQQSERGEMGSSSSSFGL
ncbi:BDNF/NT-3 growth factors receptor-like [Lytechinus pictus]|uniref:BDNF/NT-3 growth factors receptor-like n=1 Tax=Lytechinus pictus TaxID=7653 RepID=UPI0030BA1939